MTMNLPGLGGQAGPPIAPPITPPTTATPSIADIAKRLDDLEARITALEEGAETEGEIPMLPDMGGGMSPPTVAA